MEALLFLINSIVIVVIVFQGLMDDKRAPGEPQRALFRTRDIVSRPRKPRRGAAVHEWQDDLLP